MPAPSMKEAMPHDAQRSLPGSRTHEPIDCYAKFCKLVLESILAGRADTLNGGFILLAPAVGPNAVLNFPND